MEASLLHGLISILMFQPCKSQDGVTATPFVAEANDPNPVMMLGEPVLTAPHAGASTEDPDAGTEAPHPTEPQQKGHTYVPLMSQASEVIDGPERNGRAEINATEDQPLNTDATEHVQTVRNAGLDQTGNDKRGSAESEPAVADLGSWRIGAISVVATLSLGVVIAIYCLKFRKKTRRPEVPVKEDSEAGETVHGESNQNTVTAGDAQLIQSVSNGSLDLTTTKQQANLSAISGDSPTEAVSSQEPSSDVRNIVV